MAILIKIMDFVGKILLVMTMIYLVGCKAFFRFWDNSIIGEKPPKEK